MRGETLKATGRQGHLSTIYFMNYGVIEFRLSSKVVTKDRLSP